MFPPMLAAPNKDYSDPIVIPILDCQYKRENPKRMYFLVCCTISGVGLWFSNPHSFMLPTAEGGGGFSEHLGVGISSFREPDKASKPQR